MFNISAFKVLSLYNWRMSSSDLESRLLVFFCKRVELLMSE
jgi:hypothetical protein